MTAGPKSSEEGGLCLHWESHYKDTVSMEKTYTDHAGLEISVNSRIASQFSRQIANGNAGPTTALGGPYVEH